MSSEASVPAPLEGRRGGALVAASEVGASAASVRERRKRVWVVWLVWLVSEEEAACCINSRWAENAWIEPCSQGQS